LAAVETRRPRAALLRRRRDMRRERKPRQAMLPLHRWLIVARRGFRRVRETAIG
jgi:hypothetical protein